MGTVIVSLDCEGLWGLADKAPNWQGLITDDSLAWAYRTLDELLVRHGVRATYAFVGMFASQPDAIPQHVAALRESAARRDWLRHAFASIDQGDLSGWIAPTGALDNAARRGHEIASHTFTHLPLVAGHVTDDDITYEIENAFGWGSDAGLPVRTFVFPRNIVPSDELLRSLGVTAYRLAPAVGGRGTKDRLVRITQQMLPVAKSSPVVAQNTIPVQIPGETFLTWRYGARRMIPAALVLARWRSILNDAVAKDGVAHVWLHPHNLITGKAQDDLLDAVLREIRIRVTSGDLTVKTQLEFAEDLLGSSDA